MEFLLKKNLPRKVVLLLLMMKNVFIDPYRISSYSQEGEDMILRRIFEGQETGFYVDVGAHHPKRFSNTYYFYKKGWRGINIDAMPGSMHLFDKLRPRDYNLEMGVSLEKGNLTYFVFNESALNSFNEELSLEREKNTDYRLLNKITVSTDRLDSILSEHIKNTPIDFMSIDVEGHEMEVLQSNNWELFRPKYILIELLNSDLDSIKADSTYQFLTKIGYKLFAKTFNTYFFVEDRSS